MAHDVATKIVELAESKGRLVISVNFVGKFDQDTNFPARLAPHQ